MSTTRFKILKITILRNQLYKRLKETKKNQIKYYDEKHILRIFNVENKILLNFKNIHTSRSFKKLDYKYYNRLKYKISLKNRRINLTYFIRFDHTMFFMFLC